MSKTTNPQRYQILDFTRGVAIGLMFIYHLSFGLAQLGYFHISFSTDMFWISFRSLIVFLFLGLVGTGLFLATRESFNLKGYFRRLLLLLFYFSLITLLSKSVRPDHYVFFGILHLIFVSSILALIFSRLYWTNLFIGLVIIVMGNVLQFSLFDHPKLLWVGMTKVNPIADDYAPLIPWFGLVLIGLFIGRYIFAEHQFPSVYNWKAQHWISKLICWAGRQSIHLYFIHFQLFYVLVYLFG